MIRLMNDEGDSHNKLVHASQLIVSTNIGTVTGCVVIVDNALGYFLVLVAVVIGSLSSDTPVTLFSL